MSPIMVVCFHCILGLWWDLCRTANIFCMEITAWPRSISHTHTENDSSFPMTKIDIWLTYSTIRGAHDPPFDTVYKETMTKTPLSGQRLWMSSAIWKSAIMMKAFPIVSAPDSQREQSVCRLHLGWNRSHSSLCYCTTQHNTFVVLLQHMIR